MSTFGLRLFGVRRCHRRIAMGMWLRRTLDRIRTRRDRARRRRHLASLNDHMLRDIGLTRADALMAPSKPFWRL